MADTAPLKPKWQLILGLLPSLNTCIIAVVTAAITLGGTLATQKLAGTKTQVAKVEPSALMGTDELAHRLNLIEGHVSMIADYVAAQKMNIPGRPAVKAAPVAPAKK